MKRIHLKKGQIIQHQGNLNTNVYHVVNGLLRSYYIDTTGKEHIFMFAPEGWTIGDATPPTAPAALYIDALENTTAIVLSKDLSKEGANAEKFINRLRVLQTRIIMLMSAPAIERYEHFIKTYPAISQRVPQRMIASYLGITPEALSKVKRKRVYKA